MAFLAISVSPAGAQIINSVGRFTSLDGSASVVVKMKGDMVNFEFWVRNVSGRRAGMEVNLQQDSRWFAYIESDDTVWLYRGGDSVIRFKAILSEVESQYSFDRSLFSLRDDSKDFPTAFRKHIVDSKILELSNDAATK